MNREPPGRLQIAYLPNTAFAAPLVARLNAATSSRLRSKRLTWTTSGLANLAGAVSSKLTMLGLVGERLYSQLIPLAKELGSDPDVIRAFQENKGWVPADEKLPYQILVEIDCFIFEFRSAYEILGKFLTLFFKRILDTTLTETQITQRLEHGGADTSWAVLLREKRKLFFHNSVPWLAIDVKQLDPIDFELVILDRVAGTSESPAEIKVLDLRKIYNGFALALSSIQEWTLSEITRADAQG